MRQSVLLAGLILGPGLTAGTPFHRTAEPAEVQPCAECTQIYVGLYHDYIHMMSQFGGTWDCNNSEGMGCHAAPYLFSCGIHPFICMWQARADSVADRLDSAIKAGDLGAIGRLAEAYPTNVIYDAESGAGSLRGCDGEVLQEFKTNPPRD